MGIFNPFNPFLSSFLPASFLKQRTLKQELEPEPSGSTGSSEPDPEPLNLVIPKKQEPALEQDDNVNYDNINIDKTYEMKHNKPKQRNYKVRFHI